MGKQRENMAAIYCRLSRDDGGDAESNSIGNQREQLRRYADEHGFAGFQVFPINTLPRFPIDASLTVSTPKLVKMIFCHF